MKKVTQKRTEKYVTEKTFESSMRAIAKSFEGVQETLKKHSQALEVILKTVASTQEDNKYFRQSISGLDKESFSQDKKIENLTMRVEKLEAKV